MTRVPCPISHVPFVGFSVLSSHHQLSHQLYLDHILHMLRPQLNLRLTAIYLAVASLVLFSARPAYADTFTVDSNADTHDVEPGDGTCADSQGNCSLRAAIEEANAFPGTDTIIAPADIYMLSLGSLIMYSDLELVGASGAGTVIDGTENEDEQNIKVCNDPECSLDNLLPEVTAVISNVTVQNAFTTGFGGAGTGAGIYVLPGAVLRLSESNVRDNFTQRAPGGGIANAGVVELMRVRIANNATTVDTGGGQMQAGGGVINFSGAKMSIEQSAIVYNESSRGGGIYNGGGFLEMRNTTVSNNRASRRGGGLLLQGVSHISFSTIAENSLDPVPGGTVGQELAGGGGLHNEGLLLIAASILADNIDNRSPALADYSPDCYSPFAEDDPNEWETDFFSFGGNIIGIQNPENCIIIDYEEGGAPKNDLIGTEASPVFPFLASLQFNGGFTENHRLLPISPAIDFGKGIADAPIAYCPEEDQRGFIRLQEGNTVCDSGAYEITEETSGKTADAPLADPQEAFPLTTEPAESFELQNYPEPFNPTTTIRFSLSKAELVRLDVFDILGRHVQTLVNDRLNPGSHEVAFDATGLPSGSYLYRLQTPAGLETRQMLVVK